MAHSVDMLSDPVRRSTSPHQKCRGYLYKRSEYVPAVWQIRHFRWDGEYFTCHKTESEKSCAIMRISGCNLKSVRVVSDAKQLRKNIFRLEIKDRKDLILAASTRSQMDAWVHLLWDFIVEFDLRNAMNPSDIDLFNGSDVKLDMSLDGLIDEIHNFGSKYSISGSLESPKARSGNESPALHFGPPNYAPSDLEFNFARESRYQPSLKDESVKKNAKGARFGVSRFQSIISFCASYAKKATHISLNKIKSS